MMIVIGIYKIKLSKRLIIKRQKRKYQANTNQKRTGVTCN